MLNRQTYMAEMIVLQAYYSKTLDDILLLKIYDILSEEIDTEQFQFACKQVFRHEKFFPTPQQFIDYALGNPDFMALEAWNNRKRVVKSPATIFALECIKHTDQINGNLDFIKRDFITAFKAFRTAPPKSNILPSREQKWLDAIKKGSDATSKISDSMRLSEHKTEYFEFLEFYKEHKYLVPNDYKN